MIKYMFSWVILLVVAFLNAAIREIVYKNYFKENVSHQISVFTGIFLLGGSIFLIVKFWPFETARQSVLVGLIWVAMTEFFEYSMFLLERKTFADFLHVHNIFAGEFWILILIWVAISPYLFHRLLLSRPN